MFQLAQKHRIALDIFLALFFFVIAVDIANDVRLYVKNHNIVRQDYSGTLWTHIVQPGQSFKIERFIKGEPANCTAMVSRWMSL